MTCGVSSRMTVRPSTFGLPPKSRFHREAPSTTGRGPSASVARNVRPSKRMHAKRREQFGGRQHAFEPLGQPGPGQVHRGRSERRHPREPRGHLLPVTVPGLAKAEARVSLERVVLPELDQAGRLGKRQRAHQDVIGDREDRGRGANAQRHDEDAGDGKPPGTKQGPCGIADVLAQQVGVHATRIARGLGDGHEPEQRDGPRAGGIPSAPGEDGRHLARVLVTEGLRKQPEQQPIRAHHALPVRKPLARASRRSDARRAASAFATARPNGVIR